MKKLLSITLALALLLALAACGGGTETPFSGAWTFDSTEDENGGLELGTKLVFYRSDFIRVSGDNIIAGTFTFDESEGTLTLTDNNGTVHALDYVFENDTLLLNQNREPQDKYTRLTNDNDGSVNFNYYNAMISDQNNNQNNGGNGGGLPGESANNNDGGTTDGGGANNGGGTTGGEGTAGDGGTTANGGNGASQTGDPRAVLIGNWTATQTTPYVEPYSFPMSIMEDGFYTFDFGGSATGTWSGNNPVGAELPDNQVWLSDPNLEFSTTYRFDVSDGGNTITLTAMIGNWPVTTLTRAE